MEPWQITLVLGLAVPGSGLIGALINGWLSKRKTTAEAKSTEADYSVKLTSRYDVLVDQLQDEVATLRKRQIDSDTERAVERKEFEALRTEVGTLKTEVGTLRQGVKLLTDQIRKLGHEPAWVDVTG